MPLAPVLGPDDDGRDAAHRHRPATEPLPEVDDVQRADDLGAEERGHHPRRVDQRRPPLTIRLRDRERLARARRRSR